jgi:hypothetical protein
VRRLCEIYEQKLRKKYPFDGHAARVVSELLAMTESPDAVAEAWAAALDHRGYPTVRTLQELRQHLARFLPARPEGADQLVAAETLGPVWGATLQRLRAEGKPYAAEQLQRLREASSTADGITLEAPDWTFIGWVEDHYGPLLERALAPRKLRLVIAGGGPDPPSQPSQLTLAEEMHAEDERHRLAGEVLQLVREAAVGGS